MELGVYDAFLFILGLFSTIIGFYMKRFYEKMDALEDDLHKHKIEDAATLVTKVELKDMKQDIKDFLLSIKEQLNNIESHLRHPQK
jgi:hypothetical protein